MSSSDEEVQSPELGASSSKHRPPVTPMVSESDEDDYDDVKKKTPKYKRPRVKWETVLTITKGPDAEMDDDQRNAQILDAARAFMESSKLYKLPGHKSNASDRGLWKVVKEWTTGPSTAEDNLKTRVTVLRCPLSGRFNCQCQIKITDSPEYTQLETRGVHDEDSHHPDKDRSKHLKFKQMEAIEMGVRVCPQQSARQLRRHLKNLSPENQIDPKLLRNMKRQVVKVRSQLTTEQLDQFKIDDSFGSLVRYAEGKWFTTLYSQHLDSGNDFHLGMFDVFVIGKDLNATEDIVYLNVSTMWHLCNILRNIAAGWIFQLNGDVTFKVCRRTVALLGLGVNSLGNVSNSICWAIIPEAESAEVFKSTWKAVQDAAMLLMIRFRHCRQECSTCDMIHDLMRNDNVRQFMSTSLFEAGKFPVELTLCDRSLGWGSFTRETFGFDPNMCRNHVTAIPAANHSQQKYFRSPSVYDTYYDEAVRVSKIGHETVARKALEAMVTWINDDLEDEEGAKYFDKTWSLASGFGRWPVVFGMHGGSTTNGGTEANWRDKKEICPKTATLGTFMGALVHNIECKGDEHRDRLKKACHENRFPSIPVITKETWEIVSQVHPKTMVCTLAIRVREPVHRKISDMFDSINEEMFTMGGKDMPLHLKMSKWHAENDITTCDLQFKESSLAMLYMPSQRLMNELDPDNSRDVINVRHEVWGLMEEYKKLLKEKNNDYKTMRLPDIMDLYTKFHYVTYKEPDWSVVDWGCTCVACLRDAVCPHSVLVDMFFNSSLRVPDSLEQTVPSMRKNSMLKRGIAGSKRKRWQAAKALETKKLFVKSKKLCVKGPKICAHAHYSLHSLIFITQTLEQDATPEDAPTEEVVSALLGLRGTRDVDKEVIAPPLTMLPRSARAAAVAPSVFPHVPSTPLPTG